MEKLKLGQIIGAVGLKGEVRVYPYTDYKEKFEEFSYVLVGEDSRHTIQHVRYMKNMAILKLEGVDGRDQAETYKEQYLYIFKKDAPPLEEGRYYVHDLIGLIAIDDQDGRTIGRLKDVTQNAVQDLYEIELRSGKSFLLPAVEEFVREIDIEKGVITVHLIEGMTEL